MVHDVPAHMEEPAEADEAVGVEPLVSRVEHKRSVRTVRILAAVTLFFGPGLAALDNRDPFDRRGSARECVP